MTRVHRKTETGSLEKNSKGGSFSYQKALASLGDFGIDEGDLRSIRRKIWHPINLENAIINLNNFLGEFKPEMHRKAYNEFREEIIQNMRNIGYLKKGAEGYQRVLSRLKGTSAYTVSKATREQPNNEKVKESKTYQKPFKVDLAARLLQERKGEDRASSSVLRALGVQIRPAYQKQTRIDEIERGIRKANTAIEFFTFQRNKGNLSQEQAKESIQIQKDRIQEWRGERGSLGSESK